LLSRKTCWFGLLPSFLFLVFVCLWSVVSPLAWGMITISLLLRVISSFPLSSPVPINFS
jgi:hypothetical protein